MAVKSMKTQVLLTKQGIPQRFSIKHIREMLVRAEISVGVLKDKRLESVEEDEMQMETESLANDNLDILMMKVTVGMKMSQWIGRPGS